MKKIPVFLLTLLCILSMNATALASTEPTRTQDAAQTAAEAAAADVMPGGAYIGGETPSLRDGVRGGGEIISPLNHWNTNGWPADVSFAYEAGGEAADDGTVLVYWEIGTVNASEARKQELTAMFDPSCLITFYDCAYSHAQREAVLLEIETEAKKAHDANFISGLLINNTQQVYVVVKDEAFEEYSVKYAEKYGELVWVQSESESVSVETMPEDVETGLTGDTAQSGWLSPVLLYILAAAAAVLVLLCVRRAMIKKRSGDEK